MVIIHLKRNLLEACAKSSCLIDLVGYACSLPGGMARYISRSTLKRWRWRVAVWIVVSALVVVTDSGLAMESTPSPSNTSADDDRNRLSMTASARIIVKYVDKEAGRVANEAAAQAAAAMLSEVADIEIRHVRLMSGSTHVVEAVGLDRERRAEMIESIVERIESDPAVEYAELDAIMRIQ